MKLWVFGALLAALAVLAGVWGHSLGPSGSLPYYTGPAPSQVASPPNRYFHFPVKVKNATVENGLSLNSIDGAGYVNFSADPLPLAPLARVEQARVNLIFFDAHGDECAHLTQPLGTLRGGGGGASGSLGPIPPGAVRGELSFYGIFLGNAAQP